jgi:UDP-glucuronate 4-epimerase
LKVLVTGSAGFIGFHLTKRLLQQGYEVVGLDNINDYYDINLKYARLAELGIGRSEIQEREIVTSPLNPLHRFIKINLEDKEDIDNLFREEKFDFIINLAAQAGVRYSLENPDVYIQSNIIGFYNLLEACRHHPVKHFVFASSSSVYGDSNEVPFKEDAAVDTPISLYAATKKSGELMAYTYSSLFKIPLTGLRFFTVYGPWGRPDMALSLFTEAIINGEAIKVFNNGDLSRDFTYIDDIVEGIDLVVHKAPNKVNGKPPYGILNIGNNQPVQLMDFISAIEESLHMKAIIDYQPMQPGDVHQTWADVTELSKLTGYKSKTLIKEGVAKYINWFQEYTISRS